MKILYKFLNFISKCFPPEKIYDESNLHELKGTELQYVSNDLNMPVYIANIDINKGITLMGKWYDKYYGKYEDEDSVIFCINKELNDYDVETFLRKVNEAVHSGVWWYDNSAYYFGGKVDDKCAFK